MAYHYVESGLDNIWLENGFTVHNTSHGEGISIDDVDGLHRIILKWLAETPKPLTGADLRFIRIEMDLTQRALAGLIGAEEQTLRRWEKARADSILGPADRLLRALTLDFCGGDGSVRALINRIAELNQLHQATAHLREVDGSWQVEPEVCAA